MKVNKSFSIRLASEMILRCLILMADWCGDVIRNIPVVFKALERTLMPVEVMIMEQFPELMDQFLTGGRKGCSDCYHC